MHFANYLKIHIAIFFFSEKGLYVVLPIDDYHPVHVMSMENQWIQ
jgi:hypothetical protein